MESLQAEDAVQPPRSSRKRVRFSDEATGDVVKAKGNKATVLCDIGMQHRLYALL